MASYFVKNGGSDAADGLSDGNAWATVAKVSGSSFSPGDSISFKCGSLWRESLTVPSAGSSVSPITFNAYGSGATPRITGGNALGTTGWSKTVGRTNVYEKALTTDPSYFVLESALPLVKVASVAACDALAGSFFWAANLLSLNATGSSKDPTTNGLTYETPIRQYPINMNSQDYITVSGLQLDLAIEFPIYADQAEYANYTSLDIRYSKWNGIYTATGSPKTNNVTVTNCSFTGMAESPSFSAIRMAGDNWTIIGCTFYRCMRAIAMVDSNNAHCQNFLISDCTFTECGRDVNGAAAPSPGGNAGIGLFGDVSGDNSDYHQGVITGCTFTNLIGRAIDGWMGVSRITYNIIDTVLTSADGGGLAIEVNGPNNIVANNTIYNSQSIGIMLNTDPIAPSIGTQVRNNIVIQGATGPDTVQFRAASRGVTDPYSNNIYYRVAAGGVFFDDQGTLRQFAAWAGVYGESGSSEQDPKVVSLSGHNFNLQPSSPAIDAGVQVPNVTVGIPDIGAEQSASSFQVLVATWSGVRNR